LDRIVWRRLVVVLVGSKPHAKQESQITQIKPQITRKANYGASGKVIIYSCAKRHNFWTEPQP
jgi:hypothetical protein